MWRAQAAGMAPMYLLILLPAKGRELEQDIEPSRWASAASSAIAVVTNSSIPVLVSVATT
jgi:hypothetical protein